MPRRRHAVGAIRRGRGCPPGFRILINWFTGTRKNLTLGFPENFNKLELSRGYSTHTKNMKPVPHEIVDDGPVFENVLEGDDIDVTRFPRHCGTLTTAGVTSVLAAST